MGKDYTYLNDKNKVGETNHDAAMAAAIGAFEEGINKKMNLDTIPTQSDQIDKISAAFVKAQAKMGVAIKDTSNPFFKSKYADLASVMEACKEALNSEGIGVLQPFGSDGDTYTVKTIFLHTSGQYFSSTLKLILSKHDMQSLGSACSYARRYALQSMGFVPAEDDDGNASSNKQPEQRFSNNTMSYGPPRTAQPARPIQPAQPKYPQPQGNPSDNLFDNFK